MAKQPRVGIVVLNWNNYDNTRQCLQSIRGLLYENFDCIVVDNGSTDNSVERLKAEFADVVFIENGCNLGFAGGCNAGIREALNRECEYILLLNDDVVAGSESLTHMVDHLQRQSDAGLAGGKVYYADYPDTIWCAGGDIDWFRASFVGRGLGTKDRGQYENTREVDYVPGAVMIIRSEVFAQVGLLPECYFFGGEEADFCVAARRKGFRSFYVGSALFWHRVGVSGTVSLGAEYRRARNRLLFVDRNFPTPVKQIWLTGYRLRAAILRMIAQACKDQKRRRKSVVRDWALLDHRSKDRVTGEDLECVDQLLISRGWN